MVQGYIYSKSKSSMHRCTGYTLLIPAHVAHNTTNTDTDNSYQHKINGEWRYSLLKLPHIVQVWFGLQTEK
jgi:hypothetical protein